jgi:hypothetical protein
MAIESPTISPIIMEPQEPEWDNVWGTLRQIILHPELWNQKEWVCGTAACFAGWAVHLQGIELDPTHGAATVALTEDQLALFAGTDVFLYPSHTGGRAASIPSAASHFLGLNDYNHQFFVGTNTLLDLLSQADELATLWEKELPEDLLAQLNAELDKVAAEDGFGGN